MTTIIIKFKKTGFIQDKPRSGRKRKMTTRIDRAIVSKVERASGLSAPKIAAELEIEHGV